MAKEQLDSGVLKLLERAEENLAETDNLLEGHFYFGAANRAYYAIFHAISALLLHDGKEFSSHKAVISYFGKKYAKTGKAPKDFHKAFIKAFEIRQIADYDYDGYVDKSDAESIRKNAETIIQFVRQYISQTSQ